MGASRDLLIDDGCGAVGAEIISILARHRSVRLDVELLVRDAGASGGLAGTTVLVLGGRTRSGASSIRLIERIRSTAPGVAVYVCLRPEDRGYYDICAYSTVGADDLLVVGSDSERRALAELVRARLEAPPPDVELRAAASELPESSSRATALHLLRNACVMDEEQECASSFAVSIQTINNRLHAIDLPSASVVRRCGIQFHALELQRRGFRSREEIARRLGLPSAAALARQRRALVRSLREDEIHADLLLRLLA